MDTATITGLRDVDAEIAALEAQAVEINSQLEDARARREPLAIGLQQGLGLAEDGEIGPVTVAAMREQYEALGALLAQFGEGEQPADGNEWAV